ncbi:hypothetical protein HDU79_006922 [Rhizoclosmatium sp. JEL0117]|nr:hypothetical protein HDU79_006922 [Rhizoclosmatium sp. JEL0117]
MQGDTTTTSTSAGSSHKTLDSLDTELHNDKLHAHAQKIPGQAFSTASVASVQSVQSDLATLSQELAAFKRHGNPPFIDVQSFAERIWRANLAYETAIAKLDREKKNLTKQIDTIWGSFDTLIRPLWRVDDAIVPIYDTLADVRIRLEDLYTQKIDTIASSITTAETSELFDEELVEAQRRLHEIEEKYVVEGRFVPEGWGMEQSVPSGQAVVANLLAKCYRLVRMIQDSDPVVDRQLLPIQLRLTSIVHALKQYKSALAANKPVDPVELTSLQLHVDAIANLQQDGKFLSPGGEIPAGQAILRELLEEAYDLVHQCLVAVEEKESTQPNEGVQGLLDSVTVVIESLTLVTPLDTSDSSSTIPDRKDLLKSGPALHSFSDTLTQSYKYIRESSGDGVSTLAALSRTALETLGKAFGLVESMDPTLHPTRDRLVALKAKLMALRAEKDKHLAEKIRAADVEFHGKKFERMEYGVRTHLVVLEEIDMDRDEMGRFLNSEGEAPNMGQRELKSLLEECFVLAFELL